MKNKSNKPRFRAATKHFMDKGQDGQTLIKATYCIECLHNRRWNLVGDEKGIMKFDSKELRDEKLSEFLKCTIE
jgi:hypothetical protein